MDALTLISIVMAIPIVVALLLWMRRNDPTIRYTREGDRWDEIEQAWAERAWEDE